MIHGGHRHRVVRVGVHELAAHLGLDGDEPDGRGEELEVADEQALIERVMERGKTSGRTDDNMEVLQKRINQYKNE